MGFMLFFLCGESPSAAGLSHKRVKAQANKRVRLWLFLTHREAPGTAQFSSGKLMDVQADVNPPQRRGQVRYKHIIILAMSSNGRSGSGFLTYREAPDTSGKVAVFSRQKACGFSRRPFYCQRRTTSCDIVTT